MNIFLFDNSYQSYSFIKIDGKKIYSPNGKYKIFNWLLGVIKVLYISKKDDIIICWFDFQAVLCYWIGLLFIKPRRIICVNLMLKKKTSLRNKLVTWLYKGALMNRRFIASVTSVEYGIQLLERLNIKKELFLLHDVYNDSYQFQKNVTIVQNSIFCGGRNGRDWNFMLEVARSIPECIFNLVMPKDIYAKLNMDLPSNVIVKCNLSYNEFMEELCKSELVCLPLDTEAPAGLIVLFQSAANMKYILTTETCTTREYLSEGRGSLLPNNVESWVRTIREHLSNKENNIVSSKKLLDFLRNDCSELKYVYGLEKMISKAIKE